MITANDQYGTFAKWDQWNARLMILACEQIMASNHDSLDMKVMAAKMRTDYFRELLRSQLANISRD